MAFISVKKCMLIFYENSVPRLKKKKFAHFPFFRQTHYYMEQFCLNIFVFVTKFILNSVRHHEIELNAWYITVIISFVQL